MGSRFPIKQEIASIHEGLTGYQGEVGTKVLWFAFDRVGSQPNPGTAGDDIYDDVYDEGSQTDALEWSDPIPVPVLSAVRYEGPRQVHDTGFYTTDRLHLSIDLRQARQTGLSNIDLRSVERMHDRLVYDNVVFRIMDIQIRGQLEDEDVVIGIDAIEVDPSELVNAPDFTNWAA